ncbi:MAG: hypothetical protein U0570_11770 [Phycisphaerales bacterium]
MRLDEALEQISDIRRQMVKRQVFRGYRALTVGFSGVLGVGAAAVQQRWAGAPEVGAGLFLDRYLVLWAGVAATSLLAAALEIVWRVGRDGLAKRHAMLAVERFGPSVVVGGLLMVCIYRGEPAAAWMLPGLWAMIFGLGIFASNELLPRKAVAVGMYYILCGCASLLWGHGERAFSPWLMGTTFGGGQLLAAVIVYLHVERHDGAAEGQRRG